MRSSVMQDARGHKPANGTSRLIVFSGLLLVFAGALTGCRATQTATANGSAVANHTNGRVIGGQQPLVGTDIQLYAAGTTGYGSAYAYTLGKSLLGAHVVTTDANGNFDLTGTYSCPAPETEVYLVGTGGSPIASQSPNTNVAMMAALGPCGNLTSNTFISMNEVTTVASVWALSPFMAGIVNVGTTSTNAVGLTNAFLAVTKLANTATGRISGPNLPLGAILPVSEINTLADILAACINSAGGTAGDSTPCGALFSLAPSVQGVVPTDTITAALNIAQNPSRNVQALNYLVSASPPFQPTLISAPIAWTVAIKYKGNGGLSAPTTIASDQAGNIWLNNVGGANVVELNNTGSVLSGAVGYAAGLAGAGPIAIDQTGDAWVAGANPGSLLRVTDHGTNTYTGGGLSTTTALAVDAQGNIWAVGDHSVLSLFDSNGAALSPPAGYQVADTLAAQSIAVSPY